MSICVCMSVETLPAYETSAFIFQGSLWSMVALNVVTSGCSSSLVSIVVIAFMPGPSPVLPNVGGGNLCVSMSSRLGHNGSL